MNPNDIFFYELDSGHPQIVVVYGILFSHITRWCNVILFLYSTHAY